MQLHHGRKQPDEADFEEGGISIDSWDELIGKQPFLCMGNKVYLLR